jgi:predicted phage baseplate assembly protein
MKPGCLCCEGRTIETPRAIDNPPGHDAVTYRVGTHADFFESMLARLGSMRLAAGVPALSARSTDDAAVALLDAGAVLADVVTFYQERIANEAFLRTATEPRSLLELASMVGYQPRPGVAASVPLAFTVDAGHRLTLPAGQSARSTPGQDEKAQVFETGAALEARDVWSAMTPRLTRRHGVTKATAPQIGEFYFDGVETKLKPNDALLFVSGSGDAEQCLRKVATVELQSTAKRTRVTLLPVQTLHDPADRANAILAVFPEPPSLPGTPLADAVKQRFDAIRTELLKMAEAGAGRPEMVVTATTMFAQSRSTFRKGLKGEKRDVVDDWMKRALEAVAKPVDGSGPASDQPVVAVYAFRARAGIFGSNAPLKPVFDADKTVRGFDEWSLTKSNKAGAAEAYGVDLEFGGTDGTLGIVIAGRQRVDVKLTDAAGGVVEYPNPDISDGKEDIKVTVSPAPGGTDPVKTVKLEFTERLLTVTFEIDPDSGTPIHATASGSDQTEVLVERDTIDHSLPRFIVRGNTPNSTIPTERSEFLYLDTIVPQAIGGNWVVLERTERKPVAAVAAGVTEEARAEYGISGRVTRIQLPDSVRWIEPSRGFKKEIRDGVVHLQAEKLEPAEFPIPDAVYDDLIEMPPAMAPALAALPLPRLIAVAGLRASDGRPIAELARVDAVKKDHWLVLDAGLEEIYARDTVVVWANVAMATHGETVREYLGNGNGSTPNQSFTLKQTSDDAPLTYVPSSGPSGVANTLQVFVNAVRWREVDDLSVAGPSDQVYAVVRGDAGTTVRFGDSVHGARLPTGVANVTATYRVGLGAGGNVRAGQIDQLGSKPLGLQAVINPLPATGGAGPDGADALRDNTPRAIRTLDRVVSVRDYADFAASFAGVGRAAAARLSDGSRPVMVVTVAGIDDAPLDETSELVTSLGAALRENGETSEPIRVMIRERLVLGVAARVRILPDRQWRVVSDAVRAALRAAFGFGRRDFGQDVTSSEVIAVMQGVPGVDCVDVDKFGAVARPEDGLGSITGVTDRLRVERARRAGTAILPAQIALFPPAGFVSEMIALEEWGDA